jgi:uncharacterized protein (TIGR02145 family)
MKKIFFLMLTLLILSAASMNAQVLIGGNGTDNPDPSAVLELKSDNLGLLLPRVTLQSTTDKTTIANPVVGLTVYNTATAGTGATAVVPGVYYYNGSWVLISGTAPKITTQPKSFSWSRMKETNGDPNSTITTFSPTLTVAASGVGLTYQWYKKAVNKNAVDTLITSATNPTYTPTLTAWGMNSYYCVVSNTYGSVTSNVADVAAGCGAKTVTGGWLKFMCYNLGATTTANPFTFTANTSTILGNFYQWGRSGANPRAANDTTNFTTTWAYPYDWRIPAGYTAAKPLSTTYRQDDYIWRNHKTIDDPCPTGWHIPSQSAFAAIFKGTADANISGNATANTWTSTGTWSWTNATSYGNGGYAIMPDGITITLFLPATGYRRSSDGGLNVVGLRGHYWSSSTAGTLASYLYLDEVQVIPAYIEYRGVGLSIRCISD